MKYLISTMLAVLFAGLTVTLALDSNEDITVLQGLREDPDFSTLVSLLEGSDLAAELEGQDITLFAPTNEAFEDLSQERLSMVTTDDALLAEVLSLHVLPGRYSVLDINNAEAGSLNTLADQTYNVTQSAGGLTVNGINLISTDVDNTYANGVIHAVSEVMLPASLIGEDTNGDGVIDNDDLVDDVQATPLTDTNQDGVINADDIVDSNGDGVIDETDFVAAGLTDANGDGVVDAFDINPDVSTTMPMPMGITDINGDGVIDSNDLVDVNNDGVIDDNDLIALGFQDFNNDGIIDITDVSDTNNDGVIDSLDINATGPVTTEDIEDGDVITDSDNDGELNCSDGDDGIDSDGDGADADQCRN